MNPSLMRNLQNDELLRNLDDVRHLSPVIGELCRRLEEQDKEIHADGTAECPVCQASLRADYDTYSEILTLQVDK